MRSLVRLVVASALLAIAALLPLAAWQNQSTVGPIFEILSPPGGAYVSGRVTLKARVEPVSDIRNVSFYVDGSEICRPANVPFECEWDAGPTVAEHQIRAVANLKNGSRIVRTSRTKGVEYVESVEVDAVQVTATVSDGRGHFVKGLPQTAFRVFEEGQRQRITHFASEDVPLDLVVAIDISDSMGEALPKVKAAAKQFLDAIPTANPVTVLAFNDNVFELARASTDLGRRSEGLVNLEAWGATALYDVILRGIELLGRKTGRRALVVFTDGEDQGSHVPIEEVERRLAPSDVMLYMIGQGRGTSFETLKKTMRRLVDPTGGRTLFTDKPDELQKAFAELVSELSNQYLLGYSPSAIRRPGQVRRIKLEVDGRYHVRARQSYVYSPLVH